jgi:hypothetical protein
MLLMLMRQDEQQKMPEDELHQTLGGNGMAHGMADEDPAVQRPSPPSASNTPVSRIPHPLLHPLIPANPLR